MNLTARAFPGIRKPLARLLVIAPALAIIVVTLLLVLNNSVTIIVANPEAGQIDLSEWNQQSLLRLEGEWLYQPGLASGSAAAPAPKPVWIPHLFPANPAYGGSPYGAGTYRLQLSGLAPDVPYALQIINETSAYRLTVNGRETLASGTVSERPEDHRPDMRERVAYFVADHSGSAALMLEISNFSYNYGGFWKQPVFGEAKLLTHYSEHVEATDLFYFTGLIIMGLFFFGLFSINREFEALLHFALICILMAVRTLLTNHRLMYDLLADIPWDVGTRLEFLTGYLLLPAFGLFIYCLDLVRRVPALRWTYHGMTVAAIVLMLTTPNQIYAAVLPIYMELCIVVLGYFLWVLFRGLRRRRFEASFLLVAVLAAVPALLLDFYSNLTYDLMPLATFFIMVVFSVVVIKDFLELRRRHSQLEAEIIIDPLTGLHNRLYLNRIIAAGVPVSKEQRRFILFMDVDRFKSINDEHGHRIGDAVLAEAARRIRASFRQIDTVCRFAGDEFVAIAIIDAGSDSTDAIVERIRRQFDEPFQIGAISLPVRLSIGASECPADEDLEKAIRESDKAMYVEKAKRRQNELAGQPAALPAD